MQGLEVVSIRDVLSRVMVDVELLSKLFPSTMMVDLMRGFLIVQVEDCRHRFGFAELKSPPLKT